MQASARTVDGMVASLRTEMQEAAAEQRRATREMAEMLQASTPVQHAVKRAPFTMLGAGLEAVPEDPAGIRSLLMDTGRRGADGQFVTM